MNAQTERFLVPGPGGSIECALDRPQGEPLAWALLCHPHPQGGGTLDNKVIQTLARAMVQLGVASLRFNYRGVGRSEGSWDEGVGEVADAHAVLAWGAAHFPQGMPWVLGGFSFGGYVAAQCLHERPLGLAPARLLLVAPSTEKQSVPAVPAHTAVIHGESDDIVPLSATMDWARPQALPVMVIPGGGHFFHGQLPLLRQLVVQLMAGALHGGRPNSYL